MFRSKNVECWCVENRLQLPLNVDRGCPWTIITRKSQVKWRSILMPPLPAAAAAAVAIINGTSLSWCQRMTVIVLLLLLINKLLCGRMMAIELHMYAKPIYTCAAFRVRRGGRMLPACQYAQFAHDSDDSISFRMRVSLTHSARSSVTNWIVCQPIFGWPRTKIDRERDLTTLKQ